MLTMSLKSLAMFNRRKCLESRTHHRTDQLGGNSTTSICRYRYGSRAFCSLKSYIPTQPCNKCVNKVFIFNMKQGRRYMSSRRALIKAGAIPANNYPVKC